MNGIYDYLTNNAKNFDTELLDFPKMTKLWSERKISNYEYLLYVNHMAGRSFHDLSQYPIFPWIFKDYSSKQLSLNEEATYRDLSKKIAEIFDTKIAKFKRNLVDTQTRHYSDTNSLFNSYNSTPGIVMYYLVRKIPSFFIRLQSLLYVPQEKYIISLQKCWESFEYLQGDTKELIPEFYSIDNCDFLINKNQINFGMLFEGCPVNDVALPSYARNLIDMV